MAEKTKNKSKYVIILLLVVIVILAVAFVIMAVGKKEPENAGVSNSAVTEETKPKREVMVNEENVEAIVSEMAEEKATPMGYYEVKMNSTWNFENSSVASSNAYVENSLSNTNSVYFDVVDSKTGETVYASPILPVGTHIDNIVLDSKLSAGTYDCVCTYNLLDENDEPISNVSVTVTLNIEN